MMLTIHETPTKIVGLSFGDFSGLEIFCDIASKDGQREQMVNRIIVGKTDMTNSEVFGIKAKRARYYVLFCFRLVVLEPASEIKEEENLQDNRRELVSLSHLDTNIIARDLSELLLEAINKRKPLTHLHFAGLKTIRDFYSAICTQNGTPNDYILVFKNLYESVGSEAVIVALNEIREQNIILLDRNTASE